jgi:signal transduction histidine kinase
VDRVAGRGGGLAGPARAAVAVAAVACAVAITAAGLAACVRATPWDRSVLQWAAAGAVLAVAVAGVVTAAHALLGVPDQPGPVGLAGLALVPAGIAVGVRRGSARHAAAAFTEAIVAAGLAVFVGGVYLVVVIGLGRAPTEAERGLLGLSLFAGAVVAVLALPVRARLLEITARLVRADSATAEEIVTGFGARMTRAVPMDELLLQLAESLRGTLGPAGAEIWVGTGGALSRTVSVPDRPPATLTLAAHERAVAARTRVAGNGWLTVWAPQLLAGRTNALLRVAPIAHLGDLLGLIVVARPADAGPYGEEDDRLLSDLARQVGLALHNVRLDSALQESLEELRRRNAELAASRARVVAAADESRRRIERNLHDGAQQHLVALAVKLGLAQQVDEPEMVGELLAELRSDVQGAIDALRELAHGIYPPLLRERGLPEALRAAATRAPLPAEVDVRLPGRYPAEAETAVYFCCLEAMQNAGKHAGPDATVLVEVRGDASGLRFSVRDDGVGFSVDATRGAGFVNMADRLGRSAARSPSSPPRAPAPRSAAPSRPSRPEQRPQGRRREVVLAQVAGRAAAGRQLGQVGGGVGGQQHHRGSRIGGDDPPGRFVPVDARQVDVHQHDPRVGGRGQCHRLLAGCRLADHPPAGYQPHQRAGRRPERGLVVDDQHADWDRLGGRSRVAQCCRHTVSMRPKGRARQGRPPHPRGGAGTPVRVSPAARRSRRSARRGRAGRPSPAG